MHLITHVYVYIIYVYICLYTSEMNDSDVIRDKREELEILYYNVLALPVQGTVVSESGFGLVGNVSC